MLFRFTSPSPLTKGCNIVSVFVQSEGRMTLLGKETDKGKF